jgi:hypothetical protein
LFRNVTSEGKADVAEDFRVLAQVMTVRGLITVDRSPFMKALRVRSASAHHVG